MNTGKYKRLMASRAWAPERALGVLRPGVEALLLAAVAIGCAQAGWSALTPHIAYGSAEEGLVRADAERLHQAAQAIQTPFSPALATDAGSHAASAVLASIKLAGVRVSTDASRSGAILTLEDGAQRAYLVGQEVSAGVRLADVRADYVLLSYDGGQAQLAMEPSPSFSFARALMGEEALEYSDVREFHEEAAPEAEAAPVAQAPEAPVAEAPAAVPSQAAAANPAESTADIRVAEAAAARAPAAEMAAAPVRDTREAEAAGPAREPEGTPELEGAPAAESTAAAAPAAEAIVLLAEAKAPADTPSLGGADAAAGPLWLSETLARPTPVDGRGLGWRLRSPAPREARAAGLRGGDIIVAVNGLGPERMMEALSAAASGSVELSVMRGKRERTIVLKPAIEYPA